jgi:hypothetical protein
MAYYRPGIEAVVSDGKIELRLAQGSGTYTRTVTDGDLVTEIEAAAVLHDLRHAPITRMSVYNWTRVGTTEGGPLKTRTLKSGRGRPVRAVLVADLRRYARRLGHHLVDECSQEDE